jgi:hypothetical protein
VEGGDQAGEELGEERVEEAGVVTEVTAAELGLVTVGIEEASNSSRSSGSHTHSSSST